MAWGNTPVALRRFASASHLLSYRSVRSALAMYRPCAKGSHEAVSEAQESVQGHDDSVWRGGRDRRLVVSNLCLEALRHFAGGVNGAWRWWQGEYKGRPTIENTHRVAERALQAG